MEECPIKFQADFSSAFNHLEMNLAPSIQVNWQLFFQIAQVYANLLI